jgi:hypothetical protein
VRISAWCDYGTEPPSDPPAVFLEESSDGGETWRTVVAGEIPQDEVVDATVVPTAAMWRVRWQVVERDDSLFWLLTMRV